MGRHVAFVIHHAYVDALACFREPIKALADDGWNVDLYTTLSSFHAVPNFHRENVRLLPIEVSRAGVVCLMVRLVTHRPKYSWIFSVPQWSLYYAGLASRLAKIPMVCISDELIAEAELVTPEQKKWKARERRAHRKCTLTIALSEERGEFIRAENRLPADHKLLVIPNSGPGPSRRLRSRYYHDALQIPENSRILLHAGSLWWQPALDLAEIAEGWTGNWVLAMQGRIPAQIAGKENGEHVRFSRTVLPAEMLDYAASSAHIGLSLYPDLSTNVRLMGTASGKLGLYFKNALPVITTGQPCFRWIEETGCGLCVRDMTKVEAAAERIWETYDLYVERVKAYYSQHLDFGRNFEPLRRRLTSDKRLSRPGDPS